LNNPFWGKRGRAVCFSVQFYPTPTSPSQTNRLRKCLQVASVSVAWIVLMIYINFKARSRDPKARIRLPLTPMSASLGSRKSSLFKFRGPHPLLLLSSKRFDVPSCIGDRRAQDFSAHIIESITSIYTAFCLNRVFREMFLPFAKNQKLKNAICICHLSMIHCTHQD